MLGGGVAKRKSKSKKNKKTRSKKQKAEKKILELINGSSVFKDKNGYYIDEWDNDKQVIYKKYLKSWKPVISDTRLILDKKTKKWKIVTKKDNPKKKKSKKKSRKNQERRKKAGNHKKTSNLQAAEDDIIGLATDGLADGAAVAAV